YCAHGRRLARAAGRTENFCGRSGICFSAIPTPSTPLFGAFALRHGCEALARENRCIDPADTGCPFWDGSMASLIICLDGTWNNADSAEAQTNIGLLASMIDPKPQGGIPAQIYYDAGVGTSGSATHRLAGGVLGKGLSTNILEAYRFLSLNYRPGD